MYMTQDPFILLLWNYKINPLTLIFPFDDIMVQDYNREKKKTMSKVISVAVTQKI